MRGLKKYYAFLLLLFIIELEKVIRRIQRNNCKIKIGETTLDTLGFVNDLNLPGEDKEMVIENKTTLKHE